MMELTGPQKQAVSYRGNNLLVAAAAGSGKTAVLVERVIRRITDTPDPVDIDRFLIVTFTNAAASEMRERIGGAIIKAMEETRDGPAQKRLQRQLVLLNHAGICTIHSFCLDVIRNNVHLLDIDPAFRIADEAEAELIRHEAIEELFEKTYDSESEEPGNPFYTLIESYSGTRDDIGLQNYIMELHEFAISNPYPYDWLLEKAAMFRAVEGMDFAITEWGKELLRTLGIEIAGLTGMLLQVAEQAAEYCELDGYRERVLDDLEKLGKLGMDIACCERWDDMNQAVSSLEFGKLPPRRKAKQPHAADGQQDEDDIGLQRTADSVKRVREAVKKKLREMKRDIYGADTKQLIDEFSAVHPLMERLAELVTEYGSIYAARKRARKVIDFSDIEHLCLRLLTDSGTGAALQAGGGMASGIAKALRERYEEVLVDEYQDSNLIQESIINLVSGCDDGRRNIFMVGDVKQSIYRFREARPELFLTKYGKYSDVSDTSSIGPQDGNASDSERSSEEGVRIILGHNFRSRPQILEGVNLLFRRIMRRETGELEYDDNEALYPAADFGKPTEGYETGGPVRLVIISKNDAGAADGVSVDTAAREHDKQTEDSGITDSGLPGSGTDAGTDAGTDDGTEPEELDTIRLEARYAASVIKRIAYDDDFRIYDRAAGVYRKAMFRDIAVLMRSTKGWAEIFAEELSLLGIPVFSDVNAGYFKALEVRTMLALLQVIDNPLQDIPLLAVLRSPITGMTLDDLARLRSENKGSCFYDALKLYNGDDDSLRVKVSDFVTKLEKWRNRAELTSLSEFIWEIMDETGYYSYCGALPGGMQRQANLRILYERAKRFEETSYRGLFNFITFIDNFRMNRGDMGSAKVLGENEDVVRIMSIHKSKGLEFPVVILAGCGRRFNMRDLNSGILVHHRLGFGPEYVDLTRRIRYPTAAKLALKSKLKLESLSEEMRLLYVAMTRAREVLIMIGTVGNMDSSMVKWRNFGRENDKVPLWKLMNSLSFLDWIGSALAGSIENRLEGGQQGAVQDGENWEITLAARSEIISGSSFEPSELKKGIDGNNISAEYSCMDEVAERLEWKYPYPLYSKVPAKVSVTELKRLEYAEEPEAFAAAPLYESPLKRPGFLDELTGLTPAEKGTALHFVMQHLDIDALAGFAKKSGSDDFESLIDEISQQTDRMLRIRMLTEIQVSSIDNRRIAQFLVSDIGKGMLRSKRVMREIPFTVGLPCGEVFPRIVSRGDTMEKVMVQGMIDCCFEAETGEGLILLDYKTDSVGDASDDDIRIKYRLQMDYYGKALSMLTGERVVSRYIYLFECGRTVTFR